MKHLRALILAAVCAGIVLLLALVAVNAQQKPLLTNCKIIHDGKTTAVPCPEVKPRPVQWTVCDGTNDKTCDVVQGRKICGNYADPWRTTLALDTAVGFQVLTLASVDCIKTSSSGINYSVYIDGEIAQVLAVNRGTRTIIVRRATLGTKATKHYKGSIVWHGLTDAAPIEPELTEARIRQIVREELAKAKP